MLRLDKIIKPWRDADALADHINLYGFWSETAFLTKNGDLGMVLKLTGADYESLDYDQQEYAVKRLEAALKNFGPGFRVYQYLFKSNFPSIPFAEYRHAVVQAAQDRRQQYYRDKADKLFEIDIYYVIFLEGTQAKVGMSDALRSLIRNRTLGLSHLKAEFSDRAVRVLLRSAIDSDLGRLEQRVQAFVKQMSDLMGISVLNQSAQFRFFRRLLNYDDWRIAGQPKHSQPLDEQTVNSTLESERDHLRVGDDHVRVLTMKECIGETKPLSFHALLKIPTNFIAITEWVPIPVAMARKEVNKCRRHFNISKTGFVSHLRNDPAKTNPRDVLVDESNHDTHTTSS